MDHLTDIWINNKYRIFRHFLALFVLSSVFFNIFTPYEEPYATYAKMIACGMLLFICYANMYVIVPKLLFRNKYWVYIGVVCLYLVITAFLAAATQRWLSPYRLISFPERQGGFKLLIFLFMETMIIGASTSIKLFQRWIRDTARINELEKVTMQSELEQLKNQINPHFLFNMLNNANVLTQRDPEKASQVLMKLSDFLRYQLYDSSRPKVLLTADIHFLEDFLNLEKIRRDNFECIVEKMGDLSGVQVEPLLFITFVENAVKYSLDSEQHNYIHVSFSVQHNVLHFKCINSVSPVLREKGGLGLSNVSRRLQLLYPDRHILDIQHDETRFSVNLKINL